MVTADELYVKEVNRQSRRWRARIEKKVEGVWQDAELNVVEAKIKKGTRGDDVNIGQMFCPSMEIRTRGAGLEPGSEVRFGLAVAIGLGWSDYVVIATGIVTAEHEDGTDHILSVASYMAANGDVEFQPESSAFLTEITNLALEIGAPGVVFKGIADELKALPILDGMQGLTAREVFQNAAGMLGGWVSEDANGNIVFGALDWSDAETYTATLDTMQVLPVFSKDVLNITGFTVIKPSDDGAEDKLTTGTPVFEYTSKYMTYSVFWAMKDCVVGKTVQPGTIEQSLGNPLLEPWDKITYDGKTLYGQSMDIVFHGGVSVTMTVSATTNVEKTAQVKGPIAERAEKASEAAARAQRLATNTSNYFWADADGAHITQIPKADFLENPQGGNILINSDGMAVNDGEEEVSHFKKDSVQIGKTEDAHAIIDKDSMTFINENGDTGFVASQKSNISVLYKKEQEIGISTGTAIITLDPEADLNYGDCVIKMYGSGGSIKTARFSKGGHNAYYFQDIFCGTGSIQFLWDEIRISISEAGPEQLSSVYIRYCAPGIGPTFEFGDSDALGEYSVALGKGITTSEGRQTAVGAYNVPVAGPFVVGAGDEEQPMNGLVVHWNGMVSTPQGIANLWKIQRITFTIEALAAGKFTTMEHLELSAPDGNESYYPVSVAGWQIRNPNASAENSEWRLVPKSLYIDEVNNGVKRLNYQFANPSATAMARTATVDVYILWLHGTGTRHTS